MMRYHLSFRLRGVIRMKKNRVLFEIHAIKITRHKIVQNETKEYSNYNELKIK